MINENALSVSTGLGYSKAAMLGELDPLFDLTDPIIALAVACAALAIAAVVLRGLLDVDDDDRGARLLGTASGVARVLAFVAIIASMLGIATWIVTQAGADGFLPYALLIAR